MGNEDFSTSVSAIRCISLKSCNCAVFETVHGSAPDIARKNLANPTALLRVTSASTPLPRRFGIPSNAATGTPRS
jgi:isocitrate/isopropylmalate dehydrogenase